MKHPLDVPEGTVFSNTLAAAKPSPRAFRKAIEYLESLLANRVSIYPVRPQTLEDDA